MLLLYLPLFCSVLLYMQPKKEEMKTLTASRLILNYTRYTLYLLYSLSLWLAPSKTYGCSSDGARHAQYICELDRLYDAHVSLVAVLVCINVPDFYGRYRGVRRHSLSLTHTIYNNNDNNEKKGVNSLAKHGGKNKMLMLRLNDVECVGCL